MTKPRVIKDYDKLTEELVAAIKIAYPKGFEKKLIQFKDAKGKFVSALPFETDDYYYLVRMTKAEAQEIGDEDDFSDQEDISDGSQDVLEEPFEDDSEA